MSQASLAVWLTIAAAGIATFLIRLSFIAAHGRITMPLWFTRGLTFVPVAVLSAIILPEILVQNDMLNWSPLNPRLLAGLVAVAAAWRTKNVWVTITVGLAALWLLQQIVK